MIYHPPGQDRDRQDRDRQDRDRQDRDRQDRDRLARAALTWIAEPGDAQLGLLLQQRSAAAVMAALTAGAPLPAAPAVPGLDRAWQRWAARLGDAPTEATVDAWLRDGIRLVCPGDPEWPSQLEVLGDGQPCALWVRGEADLRFACLRSVSAPGRPPHTACT
jgi:DNA processing protein